MTLNVLPTVTLLLLVDTDMFADSALTCIVNAKAIKVVIKYFVIFSFFPPIIVYHLLNVFELVISQV